MKKVVSAVLCVLLLAVACVGHADTKSDLIEYIVELLNSDKMEGIEEVRYDEDSNTIQMLCSIDADYDMAKKVMQTDDEMSQLFLKYDVSVLRGALETAGIDGVNTMTVWLAREDKPVFISINGSDASWLLRME